MSKASRGRCLVPGLLSASLLFAAAPLASEPLSGNGDTGRVLLTAEELLGHGAGGPLEPVADSAFALPADAAPPAHAFSGTLRLGRQNRVGFRLLRDLFSLGAPPREMELPPFEVELSSSGSHLVPVDQGLQFTGHPRWNLMVGPGRIWQERADRGFTRAALPFALIERSHNCTHNGVLTFLFDQRTVSTARFQITQETCYYFQFDLWGAALAAYRPGPVRGGASIGERHAGELARRLPVRPIAALREDYPAADIDLSAFGRGLSPAHVTTWGVVAGGVHYRGPAPTRTGSYAFPEWQRLPSYSTAKTAMAAVALLRLAQRDGAEIVHARLRDYLPELARSPADWSAVTFEHALDMATGTYREAGEFADENDLATGRGFFRSESRQAKIAAALAYPSREPPGRRFVYHTTDTFLLSLALGRYLERRAGQPTDAFALVRDEVFVPLGLSAGTLTTLRTDNAPSGIPYGGFGLFWTADDIARFALFLRQGTIGERQVLHRGLLDAALQRDPEDRGLAATHRGEPRRYNNGVWAQQIDLPAAGGSRQEWLPILLGYGGIAVVLVPNGTIYYFFSDDYEYAWLDSVRQLGRLEPRPP